MPTKPTQQPKSDNPNRPLLKSGNLALWKKDVTIKDAKVTIYSISNGDDRFDVFAKVGSVQLTPEQALKIAMEEDVPVNIQHGDVSFDAMLCAGAKTTKKDGQYTNTVLHVATVIPTYNQKEDGTRNQIGWNVPMPRKSKEEKTQYASFYKSSGPKSNPVELTATDCAKLARGEKIQFEGQEISCAIKEVTKGNKTYHNAHVTVVEKANEEAVEEEGCKV